MTALFGFQCFLFAETYGKHKVYEKKNLVIHSEKLITFSIADIQRAPQAHFAPSCAIIQ